MSDELRGQPMAPDPTDPQPDPDIEAMSDDELASKLAEMSGEAAPQATEPEQKPPAAKPDDSDTVEASGSDDAESAGDADSELAPVDEPSEGASAADEPPSMDEIQAQLEAERLQREQLQARMELDRSHSSRLAGEIGHLKNLIRQQSTTPESTLGSDAWETAGRDSAGEGSEGNGSSRIADLERRITQQAVSQAIDNAVVGTYNKAIADMTDPKQRTELDEGIRAVAETYNDYWNDARSAPDAKLAERIARGVMLNMIADAKVSSFNRGRNAAMETRAAARAKATAEKAAAAPTRTTGASAAVVRPPRAKSPNDMTDEELDRALAPLG